jgi:hypothetical protein
VLFGCCLVVVWLLFGGEVWMRRCGDRGGDESVRRLHHAVMRHIIAVLRPIDTAFGMFEV